MHPDPSHRRAAPAGFTLVELLLVVVILGILAAIVLPAATNEREQAVESALRANVVRVAMMIDFVRETSDDPDTWPASVDPDWFTSGSLPRHPEAGVDTPLVEVAPAARPNALHPANKLIVPGCQGAYWYNPSNGAFVARVKNRGSAEDTLEAYNYVNQCDLPRLSSQN